MSMSNLKTEATARGLNWPDVKDAFEMVRERELEQRAHSDLVRQTAWDLTMEPHLRCYWKYGFHGPWKRWEKLLERDYTIIPNYDTIAQEVASHFPEYQGDDGAERLFGELLTKHDPMPSRETMFIMAMDVLESFHMRDTPLDEVPF